MHCLATWSFKHKLFMKSDYCRYMSWHGHLVSTHTPCMCNVLMCFPWPHIEGNSRSQRPMSGCAFLQALRPKAATQTAVAPRKHKLWVHHQLVIEWNQVGFWLLVYDCFGLLNLEVRLSGYPCKFLHKNSFDPVQLVDLINLYNFDINFDFI